MYFEEEQLERDPFEAFGEVDSTEDALVLDEFETSTAPPAADAPTTNTPRSAFSWAAFAGGLAAFAWIGAAIGGPISYYGIDAVLALDPAVQAGLIALAFGPALLFWVSASAAGEALKARRLTLELTALARQARAPFEASEQDVRALTTTVKHEIDNLNDAVGVALKRLGDLEYEAQKQAALVDEAVSASRENTTAISNALQQERDALNELRGDLREESEALAHSIGRQVRMLREASTLVRTEMRGAEEALEAHLSAFATSAATMNEQAGAMHDAADVAMHATGALNGAMAHMLDGLSEATRLTDAARQSTERAAIAANETATALREGTRVAVVEAKRAAQAIRAETEALQENAGETLARLERAAQAARAASEESQAAADRHAATLEKRLGALAATASARRPQSTQQPFPVHARPAPRTAQNTREATTLYAAAEAALARSEPVDRELRSSSRQQSNRKAFGWPKGVSTSSAAEEFALLDAANDAPDETLKHGAIDLVACAGVNLDDVLTARDLDRIARFSRDGAVSRRRAVFDAAPGAVNRIAKHVKRNAHAQTIAAEFRSRPDLAKSERRAETSELVRAYLLIDAALAS